MYKNNTVEDEFKTSVHDNYFVDVKEIDRQNYDVEEPTPADDENKDSDLTHVEDAKRDEKAQESSLVVPLSVSVTVNDTTNSKDIPDFETLKKTKPSSADDGQDETRLIDDQLDSSKFDEVVEERQYVEVPIIKEEISKQTDGTTEAKEVGEKQDGRKASKVNPQADKETENLEIMRAEARHLGQRQVSKA